MSKYVADFYKNFDYLKSKFEKKLLKSGECLLFKTKHITNAGYGRFSFGKKGGISAHRASYMFYNGKIPKGKCVLHRCDVRLCVSPDHLFLGSLKDNTQDMLKKGRHRFYNPPKKLSDDDVIFIRELYLTGDFKHRELANIFGVSTTTTINTVNFKINKRLGDSAYAELA